MIDIFSILDQKHDPEKIIFLSPKVDYNFLQLPNVNKCLFKYISLYHKGSSGSFLSDFAGLPVFVEEGGGGATMTCFH